MFEILPILAKNYVQTLFMFKQYDFVLIKVMKYLFYPYRAGIFDEYGVMRLCDDVIYPQVRS